MEQDKEEIKNEEVTKEQEENVNDQVVTHVLILKQTTIVILIVTYK